MINTTPKSKTAVDRFSGAMSPHTIPVIHNIHFMASCEAPSSVCIRDSMRAVPITTPTLANSEGCMEKPAIFIHRAASLTSAPLNSTHTSMAIDTGTNTSGTAL